MLKSILFQSGKLMSKISVLELLAKSVHYNKPHDFNKFKYNKEKDDIIMMIKNSFKKIKYANEVKVVDFY